MNLLRDARVINRFTGPYEHGWGYSLEQPDAIQFKTSADIHLMGIGLYGDVASDSFVSSMNVSRLHIDDTTEISWDVRSSPQQTDSGQRPGGIVKVAFAAPIRIQAGAWHVINANIKSAVRTAYGTGGQARLESGGVVFEFRSADVPNNGTSVAAGQIPQLYFKVGNTPPVMVEEELTSTGDELEKLRTENELLKYEITEFKHMQKQMSEKLKTRATEVENLRNSLSQCQLSALQRPKKTLLFEEQEKLDKLLICSQLENGTILYFDNAKPLELYTFIDENRVNAYLKILEGEFDCSFRGIIGNEAYFSASRGKKIKFFKATVVNDQFSLEQINELKTADLIPFENQPLYFVEESNQWIVYKYEENYEVVEGEKFDLNGIRSLRKYACHYHRGTLYFFRENDTAKLEKLNDKVVIIEGPALDGMLSFYAPPHSDFLYIAISDQNVLLILNTTNLDISQQVYEPPVDSTYHSIVGVHQGILTMLFEGKGVGRSLMRTKLC